MNTLSLHHAECSPFYRVPKFLFLNARFSSLPGDAKILYSLLLDRTSLSAQNGWLDAEHHVYIFFSVEEICSYIGCARKKALHLLTNLETIGLIRRKFRGQGRPTMIYVSKPSPQDFEQTSHNDTSKRVKTTPPEVSILHSCPCENGTHNKTDLNKTDFSQTDLISSSATSPEIPIPQQENGRKEPEVTHMREFEQNRSLVSNNISQNLLLQERPEDADLIHELVELIAETLSSKQKTLRIAENLFSAAVVRSRLLKLDAEHIRFVLDCMKENTTRIKNIRSYLLTALFHAPITINSYYSARVNHDLTVGNFSDCLMERRSENIASYTHFGTAESGTLDLTRMTRPIFPAPTYPQPKMA